MSEEMLWADLLEIAEENESGSTIFCSVVDIPPAKRPRACFCETGPWGNEVWEGVQQPLDRSLVKD